MKPVVGMKVKGGIAGGRGNGTIVAVHPTHATAARPYMDGQEYSGYDRGCEVKWERDGEVWWEHTVLLTDVESGEDLED